MPEFKVAYTEVPAEREDKETYGGVLIHIRPPVQLNPDAVQRYLTFGNLEPVDSISRVWQGLDVRDVFLLGSTAVQTTIYASIVKGYEDEVLAQELANCTVKLLRLMGVQAIIDHPPTPDI